MTTDAITLSDRQDLLSIIPVVLGYHPTNSVVVASLTGHRPSRLGPLMRTDFPTGSQLTEILTDLGDLAGRSGDAA